MKGGHSDWRRAARAPTAVAACAIWARGLRAADALALVCSRRTCAPPSGLLVSLIRMLGAINPTDQKIQKLKLDDSQIADLLVFEAVLEIVAKATTLAWAS